MKLIKGLLKGLLIVVLLCVVYLFVYVFLWPLLPLLCVVFFFLMIPILVVGAILKLAYVIYALFTGKVPFPVEYDDGEHDKAIYGERTDYYCGYAFDLDKDPCAGMGFDRLLDIATGGRVGWAVGGRDDD